VICGIMAIGFRSTDLMSHLVPANLTWLLLILIMLATWAANDCNLYSSSLGLTAVLPRLKRSHLAIFGGIIGIMMAEFHIAEHVISLLVLLGVFIAPISGVIITAGIDPRDSALPEKLRDVPKLRFAPFMAWMIGAGVGLLATPKEALGLGLIKLSTIPTVDAILVSMLVMTVLKSRFMNYVAASAERLLSKSDHLIIETES